MPYTNHYRLADDVIAHLTPVVATIGDPFLASRYAGMAAIAAVTVYELAIKEIFISFAQAKHNVFGAFTSSHFARINGRVGHTHIRNDYIKRFGDRYVARFDRHLAAAERAALATARRSVISSYGNVVTWRNSFAHEGVMPPTATYAEVAQSYDLGKEIIRCLADTMRR